MLSVRRLKRDVHGVASCNRRVSVVSQVATVRVFSCTRCFILMSCDVMLRARSSRTVPLPPPRIVIPLSLTSARPHRVRADANSLSHMVAKESAKDLFVQAPQAGDLLCPPSSPSVRPALLHRPARPSTCCAHRQAARHGVFAGRIGHQHDLLLPAFL